MKNCLLLALFFFGITAIGHAGPKHKRDGSRLPIIDREFSEKLSIRERKIFCGKFNYSQREKAMKYAKGRGKDQCFTPDEAVLKVMEETGMSLAIKKRHEQEFSD